MALKPTEFKYVITTSILNKLYCILRLSISKDLSTVFTFIALLAVLISVLNYVLTLTLIALLLQWLIGCFRF